MKLYSINPNARGIDGAQKIQGGARSLEKQLTQLGTGFDSYVVSRLFAIIERSASRRLVVSFQETSFLPAIHRNNPQK